MLQLIFSLDRVLPPTWLHNQRFPAEVQQSRSQHVPGKTTQPSTQGHENTWNKGKKKIQRYNIENVSMVGMGLKKCWLDCFILFRNEDTSSSIYNSLKKNYCALFSYVIEPNEIKFDVRFFFLCFLLLELFYYDK